MIDLGCFNHCDIIETNLTADVSGTYVFTDQFNGQEKIFSIDLLLNDPINFEASTLNESYQHVFTITPPDASLIDSTEKYKVKIKVKI